MTDSTNLLADQQRARELISGMDALESAGALSRNAREARYIAGCLLRAQSEILDERSARRALQARIETLEAILLRRGWAELDASGALTESDGL